MKTVRFCFLMSLGGAVWGSLLGIFLGAALGSLAGAALGNLSLGLDAALFAGAAGCLAGAIYGAALAIWDCYRNTPAEPDAAARLADRPGQEHEVAAGRPTPEEVIR